MAAPLFSEGKHRKVRDRARWQIASGPSVSGWRETDAEQADTGHDQRGASELDGTFQDGAHLAALRLGEGGANFVVCQNLTEGAVVLFDVCDCVTSNDLLRKSQCGHHLWCGNR